MLDLETAKKMVEEEINISFNHEGDKLVVLDEETVEREYGWVFFYTSQRLIETGDPRYLVAGNAPIVVNRQTGELTWLGTGEPFENYLRRYEASITADPNV